MASRTEVLEPTFESEQYDLDLIAFAWRNCKTCLLRFT